MTSDKSGPVRTASPELDEDLDDTRVRKDVTRETASAETPETEPAGAGSGKSSASTSSDGSDAETTGDGAPKSDLTAEPITVAAPATGTPAPAGSTPPAPGSAPSAPAKPASSAKPGPAKPGPAKPGPAAKPAAASSAPAAAAEPPVPPAPDEPGTAVPTTGGIWRSAYEAGRSEKESRPSAASGPRDAKAPAGLVSAIGRASANADAATGSTSDAAGTTSDAPREAGTNPKSWNRVPAPDAPPAPPAPAGEGTDGVRAGAMKAAQAALDAARSAAKKVSSIMPDEDERPTAAPSTANARPEMHYTAAGVRGTATPAAAGAAGTQQRPASVPTPEVPRPAPAGPRRVRLAISRVDPWSVMKLAFLLAVAIAIMTVVATAVFWSVLDGFGVFTTVQSFVEDAVGPQSNVNLTQFVEFPRVISLATLVSICNIVLLTAIATIMAFLYNITAALVGGVHLTLTDD
ncbi:DUF3566 domain-containing protein [Promicromonospora sp. MS192]|uniref:DUF3566 domain-containing protein n=1 Tax=Promicromonospora sp. MS192 TaxID=3412684 RepID=UPI003C2C9945